MAEDGPVPAAGVILRRVRAFLCRARASPRSAPALKVRTPPVPKPAARPADAPEVRDKGYPFPLYSLDLVPFGTEPPDEERYAIHEPAGRLMLRPGLRRRAADFSPALCERAVTEALARHALDVPGFATHGLDQEWAEALRHWVERMRRQEEHRLRLAAEARVLDARRKGLLLRARKLWSRLLVAENLAGVRGRYTGGPAPRAELALIDGLQRVLARISDAAAREILREHGFGDALQIELAEVAPQLLPLRHEGAEHERARRGATDVLTVIRGAILGDLARLCKVAPLVLGPDLCGPLRMAKLFPAGRAAAGPPAP